MGKLNFEKSSGIILKKNDEFIFIIPPEKAYSWGRIVKETELLGKTLDYITQWYRSKNDVQTVLENAPALWNTLAATVAENHLQDFLIQGELGFSEEMLRKGYDEDCKQPFGSALIEIADLWYDITLDDEQKRAYREARKENRGRVMGIGFGLTGGLKAAVSSGMANTATGLAHSAFNAIANGIDEITKNNKLTKLYNNENTVEKLRLGWATSFWMMYQQHVAVINNFLIEENSAKVMDRDEILSLKKSAEIEFENLEKAHLSFEDYFNAVGSCINTFPFEITYYDKFFWYSAMLGAIDADYYDNIITYFREIQVFYPNFGGEIEADLIETILGSYAELKINDVQGIDKNIFFLFENKFKTDSEFGNNFDMGVKYLMSTEKIDSAYLKHFLVLFDKLKFVPNSFLDDSEYKTIFRRRISGFAWDYVTQNEEHFIPAIMEGNIDSIAAQIKLEPDSVHLDIIFSLMKLIGNKLSENCLQPSNDIFKNFEILKITLNIDANLNEFKAYETLEHKIEDFYRITRQTNKT
jgi:hypothetical protein